MAAVLAQAPQLRVPPAARWSDSAAYELRDAAGSLAFELAWNRSRPELRVGSAGRALAAGSDDHLAAQARLRDWAEVAFDAVTRRRIEMAEWFDDLDIAREPGRQRELARCLHRLAVHRRAAVAAVGEVRSIPGVRLGFELKDESGQSVRVQFRTIDAGQSRIHLDGSAQPLQYGDASEAVVVAAMHRYLADHVDARLLDLVWAGAEIGPGRTPPTAWRVLMTLHDYMRLSSPRLQHIGRVKDGGSLHFVFCDARGERFGVWFDRAIDSMIHGRMKFAGEGRQLFGRASPRTDDGYTLIAFGSLEEHALLTMFDAIVARGPTRFAGKEQLSELAAAVARHRAARKLAAK